MYQRKYWKKLGFRTRLGGWTGMAMIVGFRETYLAGAHLVEGDKGECLCQHGGGEILFGEDEGDQNA